MPTYAPTASPGDTRRRVWRIEISNPLAAAPSLRAYEEEVIRAADGSERALGRTRDIEIAFDPYAAAPRRDPGSDALIGGTVGHAEALAAIYALVRQAQLDADAKETP